MYVKPTWLLQTLTFFFFLFPSVHFAQLSGNYITTVSQDGNLQADANGNPISFTAAPSLFMASTVNQVSSMQAIGFDFIFMGRYYSHFTVGTNGCISLGVGNSASTILTGSQANDLTRTVAYPPAVNNGAVIAPFWDRMHTPNTLPNVQTLLTGTGNQRCRLIEWKTVVNTNGLQPASTRFQCRLYEGSGMIEFVYGEMSIVAGSSTVNASVGFTAGAGDQQFLALQNLSSFTFTSSAAAEPVTQNLVNTAVAGTITGLHSPTEGARRRMLFTPPPVYSGAPLPAGNLEISDIGATAMQLDWSDPVTTEVAWNILVSTDGLSYLPFAVLPANSTRFIAAGLTTGTTYYWKVVPCTEGSAGIAAQNSATTACSLQGVYRVGADGAIPTLTAALRKLQTHGVTGPVRFELGSSYDPAGETYPLRVPKRRLIPCSGNSFSLLITGAADLQAVNLTASNDSAVILLDSCDYVTIDGRPGAAGNINAITLTNLRAAPALVLFNSSGNVLRYLNLEGGKLNSTGTNALLWLYGTQGAGSDNNIIEQCMLSATAATAGGRNVLMLSSTTGTIVNNSNQITGNRFANSERYSLWLQNRHEGTQISGNHFYQTKPAFRIDDNARMIQVEYADLNSDVPTRIEQNYFGGTQPQALGNPMPVPYRASFACIDGRGAFRIAGNRFRRMDCYSDSAVSEAFVYAVKIEDDLATGTIAADSNFTGGPLVADSITIRQQFPFCKTNAGGMLVVSQFGTVLLTRNEFRHFNARAVPDAQVNITMLMSANYCRLTANRVEGPVINHSGGETAGIWITGGGNCVATGNSIRNMTATRPGQESTMFGIRIGGIIDSINHNTVSHLQHNQYDDQQPGTMLYGIYVRTSSAGGAANQVKGNRVFNLLNGKVMGGGVTGIYCESQIDVLANEVHCLVAKAGTLSISVSGIEGNGRLRNNMVSLGHDSLGNSVTNGLIYYAGIYGSSDLQHNSVYIGGEGVQDGFLGSAAYVNLNTGGNFAFYNNNIFVNTRSNASASFQAKHMPVNVNQTLASNNNLFWHTGNGSIFGTYMGTRYNTFSEWKQASGQDQTSLLADPLFVQPVAPAGQVNLHLLNGTPAEAAGNVNYTETVDFDGQQRSQLTPVDIGADAGIFTCAPADAGQDILVLSNTTLRLGPVQTGVNQTYLWESIPAGFTSTAANPVVVADSTRIYVLNINNGGCISRDTMQLSVLLMPQGPACANSAYSINARVLASGGYQWQVDTGSGFVSLPEGAPYTGTQTQTLQINPVPSAWYGYRYRCTAEGMTGVEFELKVENQWTGTVSNFWSNPANWSCGSLPDGNTDVVVFSGNITVDVNSSCRTLTVMPGASVTVAPGVTLTVTR